MERKKYYIFDLDGTLCDSMSLWRSEMERFPNFLDSEFKERVYEKMRGHYRDDVLLKDGVREFLERAAAEGVKMCIATGTRRDIAEPLLSKTGIMEFMEFFIDCHEVGAFKDKPDIYLAAAERLGAEIAECAVFEDAAYSAETAGKAGFYVVGIIDGVTRLDGDVTAFSDTAASGWRELAALAFNP